MLFCHDISMRATLPIRHSMDSDIVSRCTNRLGKSLVVQWRGISTKWDCRLVYNFVNIFCCDTYLKRKHRRLRAYLVGVAGKTTPKTTKLQLLHVYITLETKKLAMPITKSVQLCEGTLFSLFIHKVSLWELNAHFLTVLHKMDWKW